jgi:aminopeptidase
VTRCGEVWFDGELIRKDGLFLPKDLKPLNPENLSRKCNAAD